MMIHTVNKNEYADDAELLMVSNKLIAKNHNAYSVLAKQRIYSDVVTVEYT